MMIKMFALTLAVVFAPMSAMEELSPVLSPRTSVTNLSGLPNPTRTLIVKNFMNEIQSLDQEVVVPGDHSYKDKDGNTSLHIAVAYSADNFCSLAYCQEFIQEGADVTQLNNNGESPLALAKKFGEKDLTHYLQSQTNKLLDQAVREGSVEWVFKSIAAGADVNSQNSFGETPLSSAACKGNLEVCSFLMKHGARFQPYEQQSLSYSLPELQVHEHVSQAELLEGHSSRQLINAVKRGDKSWVKKLIDQQADLNTPNMFGVLPLQKAVDQNDTAMCQLLLACGADATGQDVKRKTPLDHVNESTPIELKILLQQHLDARLFAAIREGDAQKVKNLIAAHANVNAVESLSAWSPLYLAALLGHKEIVHLLIKEGADINKESRAGSTPLHIAVSRGYKHIAEMLLKKRTGKNPADINHQDIIKSTALMEASIGGNEDLVELLVKHGANTELHDQYNKTALMHAESNGFASIAQLLSKGDRATEDWIIANTKPCPKCPCRWMKDPSCDKMTCGRLTNQFSYGGCGAEWCWQCGSDWRRKCNHHVYTQPIASAIKERLTYKYLVNTVFDISFAAGIGYMGSKLLAVTWIGLKLVNNNTLKLGLKNTSIPAIHAPLTRNQEVNQPIQRPVETPVLDGPIFGPVEPPVTYNPSHGDHPAINTGPVHRFATNISRIEWFNKINNWTLDAAYARAEGCVIEVIYHRRDGSKYPMHYNISWVDYLAKMSILDFEIPHWVTEFLGDNLPYLVKQAQKVKESYLISVATHGTINTYAMSL